MTSPTLGADRIPAPGADERAVRAAEGIADGHSPLRRSFRPQFINRIEEIIVFRALPRAARRSITQSFWDRLARRLRAPQHSRSTSRAMAAEVAAREGYETRSSAAAATIGADTPTPRRERALTHVLSVEAEPGDRVLVEGGLP